MEFFDDIVSPDTASGGGYRPLRITVRPRGVEPPPAPLQLDDMSADVGLAPNDVEPWGSGEDPREKIAPPPRTTGLFDDIVVPAVRASTAGLRFDDSDEIVGQAAAPAKSLFFPDDDPIAEPPAPRALNGTPEHLPLIGSPMPTNIDPLAGIPIEETSKLGLFGRSIARDAIDMAGAAMKGGQAGLSNLTPSTIQMGGGEGVPSFEENAPLAVALDPKQKERSPDKGPPSDEIKQSDFPTAPRPKGGVSDSAARATAIDFFNQLAAPELAQSQALTDFVQQHPKAAGVEGALGLGVVLGIPAAGAAGVLGAGAAATRAAAGGRNLFGIGPYAGESIPARSAARNFTVAERAKIDRIGAKTGCHTCGTKNPGTMYGNFVPDHQTPSALNWEAAPQRLYPQCLSCSNAQGLGIIRLLPRLRGHQ